MRASRPRDERGQTPLSFDDFPLGVFCLRNRGCLRASLRQVGGAVTREASVPGGLRQGREPGAVLLG